MTRELSALTVLTNKINFSSITVARHHTVVAEKRVHLHYLSLLWCCGARPALTPGATPMRSTENSASTVVWIPCTSGPVYSVGFCYSFLA